MLFDFCVSNPPYQENSAPNGEGVNNSARNIFQDFYALGLEFAGCTAMIFPGGRWMQGQRRAARATDVIMPSFERVWWFPNGEEIGAHKIFDAVSIIDGVSIVLAYSPKTGYVPGGKVFLNDFEISRPGRGGVLPLSEDVAYYLEIFSKFSGGMVAARKIPARFFGPRGFFVRRFPSLVKDFNEFPECPGEGWIRAWLADERPGSSKRVKRYWLREDAIQWTPFKRDVFNSWKVVTSQASLSKRPEVATYRIIPPGYALGESWQCVGYFPSEVEAVNYAAYLSLPLVRMLLGASKGGNVASWGVFAKDLGDYSSNNDVFKSDGDLPPGHAFRGLNLGERLKLFFNL